MRHLLHSAAVTAAACVTCLLPEVSHAQTRDSASIAAAQARQAHIRYNEASARVDGGSEENAIAIDMLNQAASLFRQAGDKFNLARTHALRAYLYRGLAQTDLAIAHYREALTIFRSPIDSVGLEQSVLVDRQLGILNNLAGIFEGQRSLDSAEAAYHSALSLARSLPNSDSLQVNVLVNLSGFFLGTGQLDSALHYTDQGLAISSASALAYFTGGLLNIRAQVRNRRGEPYSAITDFHLAADAFGRTEDKARQALALSNIGWVYDVLGNSDSSRAYFARALPLVRETNDREVLMTVLGNIGAIWATEGQHEMAITYHQEVLKLARTDSLRSLEATTLTNMGRAYGKLDRSDSAEVYLAAAMQVAGSLDDPSVEADTRLVRADFLRLSGRADGSREEYRVALELARTADDRYAEAASLAGLGRLAALGGAHDSAGVFFEQSADLSSAIARASGSDLNRITFNETTSSVFGEWMMTSLHMRTEVPGHSESDAAYAGLAVAERGRAQALAQLMGEGGRSAATQDRINAGRALAQSALVGGATALVYASAGDTLVTWIVTADTIAVATQFIPREVLDTLVIALRFGVAGSDADLRGERLALRNGGPASEDLNAGLLTSSVILRAQADGGRALRREIANLLLPTALRPLLPDSGELVLVPHGSLGLVPFALLPMAQYGATLGESYALRYAPSLAALAEVEARTQVSAAGDRRVLLQSALIVGDPAMPPPFQLAGRTVELPRLPGAEREASTVARLLGGVPWLTGTAATESAVKQALPTAGLVHLATHGLVLSSSQGGRESFLAFASDAVNDGHLTVGEIIQSVILQAELVFLSACQTAVGPIRTAEGTLGLQRAMLAKGARSVLVSLWDISDEVTAFLSERFYHHWLLDQDRPTKSEALRRAQRDVQGEARNTSRPERSGWDDPFYWAAFQLVGAA